MRRDGGAAMTSTHDDYDAAARRYAAGLLRDEAERIRGVANDHDGWLASRLHWAADLEDAADWLEAGA